MEELGLPSGLVSMATDASNDEIDHAGRCRAIIESCGESVEALLARERGLLGPQTWGLAQRALYTSVAMGCITETLSTALLLEMRKRMDSDIIEETVRAILGDEVNHSRLGWTHLAYISANSDVSFLSEFLPKMLEPVLSGERGESLEQSGGDSAMVGYGVLPKKQVDDIFEETLQEVIFPGLESNGVSATAARAWSQSRFRT